METGNDAARGRWADQRSGGWTTDGMEETPGKGTTVIRAGTEKITALRCSARACPWRVPVSVVSRRSAFFRIAAEEPDAAGPWK